MYIFEMYNLLNTFRGFSTFTTRVVEYLKLCCWNTCCGICTYSWNTCSGTYTIIVGTRVVEYIQLFSWNTCSETYTIIVGTRVVEFMQLQFMQLQYV